MARGKVVRSIRDRLMAVWVILVVCVWVSPVGAEDVRFEASVDARQVVLGDSIQLNLTFYRTQNVPAPKLPRLDGFDWRYLGPSMRMSIVNGNVSNSVSHVYQLVPLREGKLLIPPLTVSYGGKEYTSEQIEISAVGQPSGGSRMPSSAPAVLGNAELKDRVFVTLQVGKHEGYVHEVIPVTIKLQVKDVGMQDIQYPEFKPEGFTVEPFGEPKQYRDSLGDYQVIEFTTHIAAVRPGTYTLGPVKIAGNLVLRQRSRRRSLFDDFGSFGSDMFDNLFGGYQLRPVELSSDAVTVTVNDLPAEGKSPFFTNAVGRYEWYVEADPTDVALGDPITLKMTVQGEGNLSAVQLPPLALGERFKVYDAEVSQENGVKRFSQVVVPIDEKVTEIPAITFSYFDPDTKQYRTVSRGPFPITVRPLSRGAEPRIFSPSQQTDGKAVTSPERLGRDIIFIKESPGRIRVRRGPLLLSPPVLWAYALPFVLCVGVFVAVRRRERMNADVRYARAFRAPRAARKNLLRVRRLSRAADTVVFYDAVFKTLQEYLGDKFHLPSAGITANIVDEELAGRRIPEGVLQDIRACFTACDAARYAPASIGAAQKERALRLLEGIIDQCERVKV